MNNKKIVILGESAVGKSSILLRYLYGKFRETSESTIGAAYSSKLVTNSDGKKEKIEIWDTAGQERYKSLVPMYYRDAHGALVVYDITNKESIKEAHKWVHELKLKGPPGIKIVILGNKLDLIEGYPSTNDFMDSHYYVSAKTGYNIEDAFHWLITNIPKVEYSRLTIDDKVNISSSSSYYLCC
tara:strand:- start:5878 stop:6429 length:552 start_codon:yes stop_codon:yes gene_type:complete